MAECPYIKEECFMWVAANKHCMGAWNKQGEIKLAKHCMAVKRERQARRSSNV